MSQDENPIRYFDNRLQKEAVKLLPGQYYATASDKALVTILGSCVAACIFDQEKKIGGMNHFMLPHSNNGEWAGNNLSTRYGNYAMEHLLNELMKVGVQKHDMQLKIYGGGNVNESMNNTVSESNIQFIKSYCNMENLKVEEEDLGGNLSRRIVFETKNGHVIVNYISDLESQMAKQEQAYKQHIEQELKQYEYEIFKQV